MREQELWTEQQKKQQQARQQAMNAMNVNAMNGGLQAAQAANAQNRALARNQAAQQPQQAQSQPLQGISAETAGKLNQAGNGYQPTAEYLAAQDALQQLRAQKPQGYTSKYSGQLEGILQELQGKKFNYDLNGDAFFQSMKDTQQQLSKQAAMDTMGMAAGLTGGYGNSAAQAVANQTYQQGLLGLNDRAMDAYNLALQRFQIEKQGLKDQFGMIGQLEGQDYDRYRDTVGDFERERDYLTGRTDTEYERGYNAFRDDQNYWLQRAEIENRAYNSEAERQEAIRQFDQDYALRRQQFNWQQDVDRRDYNRGVLESDRGYNLQREQFDYGKSQDELAQKNWQQTFDYGKEQDAIANALRQAQFDYGKQQDELAQKNWQAQFDYGKSQDELAQKNWQQTFDYGKEQDALAQRNWQAQFDYGKSQDELAQKNWQQTFDYGKQQDELAQRNWQAQFDYGKQQDALAQQNWQQQFDYNATMDMLNQQNWETQMEENIRQFNESLNWDKLSSQQKYAADYALAILQNGQMPSEELLTAAGLSAEDAQKLMAKIASGGGYTPKKTTPGGMTVLEAMERDYILDPKNAAQILEYSKGANAKYVNDTLKKGQLPSANAVQNAGMNQTDVMKQFMQGKAPQGLTPEELLRRKLGL